jgi:hypothetical protein
VEELHARAVRESVSDASTVAFERAIDQFYSRERERHLSGVPIPIDPRNNALHLHYRHTIDLPFEVTYCGQYAAGPLASNPYRFLGGYQDRHRVHNPILGADLPLMSLIAFVVAVRDIPGDPTNFRKVLEYGAYASANTAWVARYPRPSDVRPPLGTATATRIDILVAVNDPEPADNIANPDDPARTVVRW